MKETHKGLHPEVLSNWSNQSEYKDPLEFLQKVYLMKNPPKWALKQLRSKRDER